jgi:hypothetical protein
MNHFSVEGGPDNVDEPAVRVEEEVDGLGEIVTDELFESEKKTIGEATSEASFDGIGNFKTGDPTARTEMLPSLERDTLGQGVGKETTHARENVRLTKLLQGTSMEDRLSEECDREPRRVRRRETGEFRKANHLGCIERAELTSDWIGKIAHDRHQMVGSV